jgi:predicted amidohydrolase
MAGASEQGCHICVFPEMSLTGQVDPSSDADELLHLDSEPVIRLVRYTQVHSVGAIFGIAERNESGNFITQVYASQGRLMGVQRKRRVADGEGAFVQGTGNSVFRFGSLRFGIAIGTEADLDSTFSAPDRSGVQLVCFCAGQDWLEKNGLEAAKRRSSRDSVWVAMSRPAGVADDEDFAGLAAVISPTGEVTDCLSEPKEGLLVVDLPLAYEVEPAREAARVLVMDADERTLLVRFTDKAGYEWWAAPGGGLEHGETHRQGAKRELTEELGRDNIEIGPEIGRRSHTLAFNGGPWVTQRERWFLARVESFEVATAIREQVKAEYLTDFRWWTAEALRQAPVVTAPRKLAELVSAIASGRVPSSGTDLGV